MSAGIFISFAAQDRKVASTLCSALETRGYPCWISSRDILPGENFQVAIVRAIRKAKMMLLVFTANSNNSEEMTKELALASQQKLIVVPLRVEDVAPNEAFSYEFATRQWIDFFADWESAINQLCERIETAIPAVPVVAKVALTPPAAQPVIEAKAPEPVVEPVAPPAPVVFQPQPEPEPAPAPVPERVAERAAAPIPEPVVDSPAPVADLAKPPERVKEPEPAKTLATPEPAKPPVETPAPVVAAAPLAKAEAPKPVAPPSVAAPKAKTEVKPESTAPEPKPVVPERALKGLDPAVAAAVQAKAPPPARNRTGLFALVAAAVLVLVGLGFAVPALMGKRSEAKPGVTAAAHPAAPHATSLAATTPVPPAAAPAAAPATAAATATATALDPTATAVADPTAAPADPTAAPAVATPKAPRPRKPPRAPRAVRSDVPY